MGHYFSENGYETAYIGKWHLHSEQVIPKEHRRGYDYWKAINLVICNTDAYDTVLYDENDNLVRMHGYRADTFTDEAIRYISAPKDKPYFLFLSYPEPHCQNHDFSYPCPPGYEEKYRNTWMPPDLASLPGAGYHHFPGYMGMVKRLDETYGRLMDALISLGQIDNTIVLFTSDHGNHFMTRNTTCKMSGHESSIRIPMTVHGPGFNTSRVVEQNVSLVDVMPTLLDCAGIEVPDNVSGHSMKQLVRDPESTEWDNNIFVQISESSVARTLRTDRWKYIVTGDPSLDALDNPYADEYYETELYDMKNDPYELLNLIHMENYDPIKAQLRETLLDCIKNKAHEENTPTIIPAENKQQPWGILPQMFEPTAERLANMNEQWRYTPPNFD